MGNIETTTKKRQHKIIAPREERLLEVFGGCMDGGMRSGLWHWEAGV
jgi:hypothetical protein